MTLEQQLLQQIQLLPTNKKLELLNFVQVLASKNQMPHKNIPKRLGLLKDKLIVANDFDAPLPDEILNSFYEGKL